MKFSTMAAANMSMDSCPDDFKCSISLHVMKDPTILFQSGHTYERDQIEMALATRPNRDPKTNVTFQGEPMLFANHALKGAISHWRSCRSSSGGVFRVGPRPAAPRSRPTPTVPLGSEGFKYEGEYRDGKWEGQGTCWFANGNVYEGEFKTDKREGWGTCWFGNGNVYEGEYKDDKREGRGTYWTNYGEVIVGDCKAGELVGDGLRWSKDQKTTWLLKDGEIVREIGRDGLKEAKAIARLMAFSDIPL